MNTRGSWIVRQCVESLGDRRTHPVTLIQSHHRLDNHCQFNCQFDCRIVMVFGMFITRCYVS